ncbi:MAG: NAD(P)/FAD-dependent oxidoreductase [Alkalispirochaetaceae bacterium]
MKETDVLIVGGSAAGLVAAQIGRGRFPNRRFLVVRDTPKALIPCAIPYVFGDLGSTDRNILPDGLATKSGAEVIIDTVESIDREKKECHTSSGETISYEKLIIATGSRPAVPGWLRGTHLGQVYTVPKNREYIEEMLQAFPKNGTVAVIGAGFIGVELADQLRDMPMEVHLIELLPHILGMAFDEEIATAAEELLTEKGVALHTGVGVEEILGETNAEAVRLSNGEEISVDAVVLAMGYRPESSLAREAGLPITDGGFIQVDEYMRTVDPSVLAVGDCAEKRDFITRRPSGVMLASTACAEARVAAMNLYSLCSVKSFNGTVAVYSTAIGGTGFGTAGITAAAAEKEGFTVVTGSFTGVDRHPGTLANAHRQTVQLVVAKNCGTVIGGGVVGGDSAGELTNVLGLVVQNRMSVNDLLTSQIGTQPCLTASPAAYPLIKAAEMAWKELSPVQEAATAGVS